MTNDAREPRDQRDPGVSSSGAADIGRSAPVNPGVASQSEGGEPPPKTASAKRPPTGSVVKWRPSVLGVATGSLAAFLSALALLAWQLGSGNDPALGAGTAEIEQPRDRVKRKVIVTRVVHDPPKPARVTAPAAAPVTPPAAVAPPPPVAPAPPPPPPPPPPVTQSS